MSKYSNDCHLLPNLYKYLVLFKRYTTNTTLTSKSNKINKKIESINSVNTCIKVDDHHLGINEDINTSKKVLDIKAKSFVPYYLTDKAIGAKTYEIVEKIDNLYHEQFLNKSNTNFKSSSINKENFERKILDRKQTNLSKYINNKEQVDELIKALRIFPLSKLSSANEDSENRENKCQYHKCFKLFENVQKLPSVKTVLRETMTKESSMKLFVWRKKMIKQMGEESFLEYNQGLIKHGGKLHNLIEQKYKGQLIDDSTIPPQNKGHWESLQNAFNLLPQIDIHEKPMIHPFLGYLGIVDALGEYNGTKCAIEWKTSVKPKDNLLKTIDTPLQIAAYIGALNFEVTPYYKDPIKDALIVVAYQSGDPADIYHMPLELTTYYWQEWLCRLSLFWENKLTSQSHGHDRSG